MKKLLTLWGVLVLALMAMLYGLAPTASAAPASYEQVWTNDMNQTGYWAPWECTKYSDHNGWIPAEYDAAIIKDGSSVVKVYPDLTTTGAFQATGAINPANGQPYGSPHSWVMKCKFPPEQTTSTTTTTTSPPEETTTTEPTEETTTTTTTTEPVVTTTDPPVVETTVAPTVPPTTPPPTMTELPETGAATGLIAAAAVLALLAGIGAIYAARRPEETS